MSSFSSQPSASSRPSPPRKRLLTVVAPACDEEEIIARFCERVFAEVGKRPEWNLELLVVDDGSRDNTAETVRALRRENPRVGLISFSRNFGHEAAMLAGLDRARGDAAAMMDSDLQHPPELLPEMLDKLDAGFDIVNPRRSRDDAAAGFFKKWPSRIWYRILPLLSRGNPTPPPDVTDFRLVSRRALDAFLRLRESGRYSRGLFAWIGFPTAEIEYRRAPRTAGKSKYNALKLVSLALDGLTSFSTAPLRWSIYMGLATLALALGYFAYVLFVTFVRGVETPGWASILGSVLFLGGVQLVMLGIIGEYLAGVFTESKKRPPYIVREFVPPDLGEDGGGN